MVIKLKTSSGLSLIESIKLKTIGGMKSISSAFLMTTSGFRLIFGTYQPGPTPDSDLSLIVYPTYYPSNSTVVPELTVYNPHWSYNGTLSLQYKWQVADSIDGPWTDVTSFATYTLGNPSSGNTNSISFKPPLVKYTSGRVYFQFVMRATDNTATSEYYATTSPFNITVGSPTWITDPSWQGSGAVGSILSWNIGTARFDIDSTNVGYMTTIYKSNNGGVTKTYVVGTAILPDFHFSNSYNYDIVVGSGDSGYTYYASTYPVFSDVNGPKTNAETTNVISASKTVIDNYSFSMGKDLYISTNGYIGLNSGSTGYSSVPTTGSNIIVDLNDFVQYSTPGGSGAGLLLYWSNSSQYSLRWSGYVIGNENKSSHRVTYQINFYAGQPYYDIKYVYVGGSVYPTGRSLVSPGLYTDGVLVAAGTTIGYPFYISTGTTYRVYYDGSSITAGIGFTEIDTINMLSAGTVTNGNTDDGYTKITTAANQFVPFLTAPTISSITVSAAGGPVSVYFSGGSGPAYQVFWWSSASPPTGVTTPDATGTSSPLTDSTGPATTGTNYMYVRSVATVGETSVGPSVVASAWSAGFAFNMNAANVAPSGGSATISGTTTMGNTLTANVTNASGTPTPSYTYQWQRNSFGAGGTTYGNISGATGSTYTLINADANYNIRVIITFSNGVSPDQVYTSAGTATIAATYWTITYNGNGGTSPTATQVIRGFPTNVTSTVPTYSGFTFNSWNTAINGTGTSYASNALITPTSDITLYAQWTVAFTPPTSGTPALQFLRTSGSSRLDWYCDYPSISGNGSFTGMQFEIRTTAGGGTLLASGTRAYPGAATYPYSAAGTVWAFRMGTANGDIAYSTSARYGRVRTVMLGSNGTTYNSAWTAWI